MFSFTGIQRSYSFPCFHSDRIPTSLTTTKLLGQSCEMVMFQNDPRSGGIAYIGSDRLAQVGTGRVLSPGESTGWIVANNLDLFWHREETSNTYLNYMLVYNCVTPSVDIPDSFPLPEIIGFGASVTGGTDGELLRVWNTNDSGEGSLRNAIDLAAAYDSSFIWITATGTVELEDFLYSDISNVTYYVDPSYSLVVVSSATSPEVSSPRQKTIRLSLLNP